MLFYFFAFVEICRIMSNFMKIRYDIAKNGRKTLQKGEKYDKIYAY